MTERIPLVSLLSGEHSSSLMKACVGRVKNGAVFVHPTETIYGIGGRADSREVERRIRSIKERKKPSPFIIIAGNRNCFDPLGLSFSRSAAILAEEFWPGNLTLVLPSKDAPEGIGVRVSNHPFVVALCAELGVPIFSTSANLSDSPYVNDPDAIFATYNGAADFMVDAGVLPVSQPSTVVRIRADDSVAILREGAVPREQILHALRGKSNEKTAAGHL